MRQQIITGIDIGNHTIKTVIAELDRETLHPQIIGVGNTPSSGLRKGMVFDMEETINNIRESVGVAQTMAGVKVGRAYVSANGLHIHTQPSRGVIVVSRADNEITQNDIDRVIDAASTINLPPNREIIHTIPKNFTIDAQEHVKNPLGMKGVRLEADVLLVEGLSPYIRNLAKCVNANDIEVTEFVFAPLAASKAVLDKHQREHGVLSIDFGGGVSSVTLFHEGDLIHTAILPIGSRHITNDLAVAFRTSMDKAEEIKCQHGLIGTEQNSKKDKIDLSELLGETDFIVPRTQIAKIIDSRVAELFDLISDEMKKLQRGYLLPAGVVLAGGGANLTGLPDFTKNRLKLAVRVSDNYLLEGLTDQVADPAFAVATGLVLWGLEKEFSGGKLTLSSRFSYTDTVSKITRWFKNFLP
ncbi:MAG: cell division protein FtsA [Candidatus Yanofskybacteria bacterium]|nr:cell division protein FtsA [Candidatus Yanofskybacteria bacterium]